MRKSEIAKSLFMTLAAGLCAWGLMSAIFGAVVDVDLPEGGTVAISVEPEADRQAREDAAQAAKTALADAIAEAGALRAYGATQEALAASLTDALTEARAAGDIALAEITRLAALLADALTPPGDAVGVFPAGIGCWKYQAVLAEDGWFAEYLDFAQMWSPAQRLSGYPYWCEIKTDRKDHLENWDILRGRLRELAADPFCVGVGIDIEAMGGDGWTQEKHDEAWAIVAEEFPRAKRFMGPIGYAYRWQPAEFFARADGIVSFINVTRMDRDPADLWYFLAAADGFYKKPLCQGVQPQDAEGMMADPVLFAEGIRIAGFADSAIIWRADAAKGWPEITAAIAAYEKRLCERKIKVLLSDHSDATKRSHFDKALCRIVGDAGRLPDGGQAFIPSLTDNPAEAEIVWNDLDLPADYILRFVTFYDQGHGDRYDAEDNPDGLQPDVVRENLRLLERGALADQVRALLTE